MAFIFIFLFVFLLLLDSHLLLTLADQLSEPLAGSEEPNRSFLGGRSAIATGGIAAIITLASIIVFKIKTNKQRASTEGFGCFSLEALRCFSLDEILSATENFSPEYLIRNQGSGDVYGGLIDEGKHAVAVKRVLFESLTEVIAQSKLRHDNLVSLIGYCNEYLDMMILVYESIPFGTLAGNLTINTYLSWEQSLRICIGAARGLDYLHTHTDHGVSHGDLKSSNILLGRNYIPKISGFRLTKTSEPEGAQKSDVYSFGIVLLEVLRGKPLPKSRDQLELINWDTHLNQQMSPQCLRDFVAMSEKCLDDDPMKRPTMAQLVEWLECLLHDHVSGDRGSVFPEAPPIVAQPISGDPAIGVVRPSSLEAAGGSAEPTSSDSSSESESLDSQGTAEPETRSTSSGASSSDWLDSQGTAEPETGSTSSGASLSGWLDPPGTREPEARGNGSSSNPSSGEAELSYMNKESMFWDDLSQCYLMSKFAAATGNFSNSYILYDGVYRIYGGYSPSNTNSRDPSDIIYTGSYIPDDNSKLKEVSHLSHPNLPSMVGYCCSDVETIVGYKNEGYRLLLHVLSHYNLPWLMRLNICIDAAEALRCIHTAKIIHGGISPTTILLDNSSCAKLVTFGSVSSHLIEFDARRLDIMPLDIAGSTEPTEKTDVYLFGLILLILYCGNKTDYSNGYPFLLPVIVHEAIKIRTLHQITDLNLTDIGQECLNEFLRVAFCCFSPEQVHRPSMDAVLEGLKRAQYLQRCSYMRQDRNMFLSEDS